MTSLAEDAVRFAPEVGRPLRARPARHARMALTVFLLGGVVGASPLVCPGPIYEVAASIDAQGVPLNEDDLRVLLRDRETLDRVRAALAIRASTRELHSRLKTSIAEGEIYLSLLTQDPRGERSVIEALAEVAGHGLQAQVALDRLRYEDRLDQLAVAVDELRDYVRQAGESLEDLARRQTVPGAEVALKVHLRDGGLALNQVSSQATDLQVRLAKLRDARPALIEVTRRSPWSTPAQRALMALLMGMTASAAFLLLAGARGASQSPGD